VESPHTLVQPSPRRENAADEPLRQRIVRREDGPGVDERVLGRYRMLERLGTGGFGVVWRAHDELLHREVAIKRVWLGPDGDSERATREARAAARLSHPAIVALHEACPEGGAFYLISELVAGETLARLIAADSLEDEEILEIGLALASALGHAHACGVIHRDIKPQNVLVPDPGERAPQTLLAAAKLTDFGGASLVGEDALTRTGDVIGTLAYMAPEQSEGREVGVQADVYSLALVLYEALCGFNPVRGATPAATVRRIGRALPPLGRERRDLSPELTRALDLALAQEPGERATLEDLRLTLEQALERGLHRSRWRRARPSQTPQTQEQQRPRAPAPPDLARHAPIPHAPAARASSSLEARGARPRLPRTSERALTEPEAQSPPRPLRLPRAGWLAGGAVLVCWQVSAGHAGVALLALAAFVPLLLVPGQGGSPSIAVGRLAGALAPVLGLAGLAGAFPAIAGQVSSWRERAMLGVLGYWWLVLAEPLLGRHLWLGQPAGTPARVAWRGSLGLTAAHVIAPLLVLGVLFGALLWAVGAAVLPWLVRGRSAALDAVAVTVWSAAIAAAAPMLDAGLSAHATSVHARGAILGAILGGMIAVAARALRGPV
jgi:serine/threonine protein kinase